MSLSCFLSSPDIDTRSLSDKRIMGKGSFLWHCTSNTSCLALSYVISCLVLIYIIIYMPMAIAVQSLILDLWTSKSSYTFDLNQEAAHICTFIMLSSVYDRGSI